MALGIVILSSLILFANFVKSQYGTFKGFPCILWGGTCLDICPAFASWPGGCGGPATDLFCRSKGFPRAVGSAGTTVGRAIRPNDGSICLGGCGAFTKISCDMSNVNECGSNPCQNGGQCNDAYASFSCSCPNGFEGQTCNGDKDECSSNPCGNGICQDLSNQFQCDCHLGWEGGDCLTDVDECSVAPPCMNGGVCGNMAGSYQCQCPTGTDGDNCEINFDECASGPCQNGGQCVDGIDGFQCNCPPDYMDANCGTQTLVHTLSMQYLSKLKMNEMTDPTALSAFAADVLPYVLGPLEPSKKESLGWDVEESFEYCFFEGEPCDLESDIISFTDPKIGSCFTFNHFNNSFNFLGRGAGEANGLRVSFIIQQGENTPWSEAGGIRIYIHNQSEIIFPDSVSQQASPGYVNNIGFTMNEYHYLSKPYGNCTHEPISDVYYYPLAQGYSRTACFASCYLKALIATCGCSDPDFLLPPGSSVCTIDDRTCVVDFKEERGDPGTWGDECNCPMPCQMIEYDRSVSYAAYQDEVPLCYLVNNRTKCISDSFTDKVTLNIYLQLTTVVHFEEVPAYDFLSLMSELGGLLGILAGISVLSVTEILVCICRIIIALLFNYGPKPI